MNFQESVQYLYSLGHETLAMKLGLRNTQLLLEALDNPQLAFESVQIAGTNGKGSTAVLLDSICRAAHISIGLYTSPHLVSIRERIKTNDQEISEEAFAENATKVRDAAQLLLATGKIEALPTFFEHLTAIALLAFRSAGVKLAILETGLGGRLDATTVAGAKIVAITPIGLDHQEYLGETIEAIAYEKAAIIRPGVEAVIAPQTSEALDVIRKQSVQVDVEPDIEGCRAVALTSTPAGRFRASFETSIDKYSGVLIGLAGRHQILNSCVAIRLAEALRKLRFEITRAHIVEGIETATHPGRLQEYPLTPRVILDGAHNREAARALRQYLDEFVEGPLTLVFGAMRDKKLTDLAEILFPRADCLILTRPENVRAAPVEILLEVAGSFIEPEKVFAVSNVNDAIAEAGRKTPPDGVICVTGSLYLVGEAISVLNSSVVAETSCN